MVAVFAVLFGLLAPPALGADRYVDDSGTNLGPSTCLAPASPCKTIVYALTKAAAGESVRVGGGSYDETVTLGGGRSLLEDSAFKAPQTSGDAILSSSSGSTPALTVAAGDAAGTVRGLTIRGVFEPLRLGAPATITQNKFDQATPPAIASVYPAGVEVQSSAGAPAISANTFDDPTADDQRAIFVAGQASPTVSANSFDGFKSSIFISSSGAQSASAAVIDGNTITGVHSSLVSEGSGISAFDANPTITDNDIHSPVDGPGDADIAPDTVPGVNVSDTPSLPQGGAKLARNEISDHVTAVSAYGEPQPVSLNGDILASNTAVGLSLRNGAVATVRNLTAVNNPEGIRLLNAGTSLTLDSSIIDGPNAISDGPGTTCSISFSRGPLIGTGCDAFQTTAAPAFVSATNFHLQPHPANAALIDKGNPAPPPAGTTDIDGQPRVLDGNGVCPVRRDIGADEVAFAGTPPDCSPAQPPGAIKPPATPGAGKDTIAPAISSLSMLRRRFAVSRRRTPVRLSASRRPKRGSAFRFRLSEPATVRIKIEKRVRGRRVGRECRRARGRVPRRRRCRRWQAAGGTLVREDLAAGRRKVDFSGRIGSRKLGAGLYRASLRAVDKAGNRSKLKGIRFRIVR